MPRAPADLAGGLESASRSATGRKGGTHARALQQAGSRVAARVQIYACIKPKNQCVSQKALGCILCPFKHRRGPSMNSPGSRSPRQPRARRCHTPGLEMEERKVEGKQTTRNVKEGTYHSVMAAVARTCPQGCIPVEIEEDTDEMDTK